ncbi:hypothetical protein AB4099_27655 [Bosea sp. 2KB_26]|uniref:hypothetical protein n=1 Tax=Bosea sp. 2KB_26 TaxID=3237475 RepID=UPI003F9091D4
MHRVSAVAFAATLASSFTICGAQARELRIALPSNVNTLDPDNGEKLDAEAVKWNVERVLDPKTGARNKPWCAAISEVKVISPTVSSSPPRPLILTCPTRRRCSC